jgi:hypothetical protein
MGTGGCELHSGKMRWVAQGRAPADDERAGLLRFAHGFAVHSQQQVPRLQPCIRRVSLGTSEVEVSMSGVFEGSLCTARCTKRGPSSRPPYIGEYLQFAAGNRRATREQLRNH